VQLWDYSSTFATDLWSTEESRLHQMERDKPAGKACGGQLMATEKRLIDVDVLIAGYRECVEHDRHEYIPPAMIVEDLESQPLVDAVEVVRCKDCKHRTLDFFGGDCCKLHKGLAMVTDESFCSYGERKDNDG
jgi:hypothetical protein